MSKHLRESVRGRRRFLINELIKLHQSDMEIRKHIVVGCLERKIVSTRTRKDNMDCPFYYHF